MSLTKLADSGWLAHGLTLFDSTTGMQAVPNVNQFQNMSLLAIPIFISENITHISM